MGNEILSLVQQDTKNQGHIHITKSVIRPIKYGIQRPAPVQIPHDIKEQFKHNANSLEHHHIQIRQSESHEYYKNPEESHYQAGDKRRMIRQLSESSELSYRKLQPLRSDKGFQQKEIQHTNEYIKTNFRKSTEQRAPLKESFTEETQITINYLPVVSKMISILKPFQRQLQLLDESKVKKIRIDHSGDIYKGQLNDFNQPDGFGMLIKQNGSTLIGKFSIGLAKGESFFIYYNGSYYKGNMVDSMANDAQGFFHSVDMTYVGGFLNNAFHGQCKQLGDDYHFQGQYENNIKKKGILSWEIKQKSNKSRLKSTNKQNQQKDEENKGQKYRSNELIKVDQPQARNFQTIPQYNYIYEGEFDIHQLFTGKGTLKDPQGTYIGEFHRGMKHGKGQYEYKSQIKYIGEYDSDKRSGFGALMNCDNTIAYQGNWSNGLPNGKGCSYDLKGRKTECEFIDGLPGKIVPSN